MTRWNAKPGRNENDDTLAVGTIMSQSEIQVKVRNRLVALVTAVVAVILVIVFRRLGIRAVERFDAENFARAVIAQNPKVFERLAEM